jgi:hypothetical protein
MTENMPQEFSRLMESQPLTGRFDGTVLGYRNWNWVTRRRMSQLC